MIVKDEEEFLAACLDSVKDLVAEMIIVDTGSSDRTMDIARDYGAQVYAIPWKDDFAQARNYGLRRAGQPWILYMDADERLHPPHHHAIRKAIAGNGADAFYIRVHSQVGNVLGNIPHVQGYPRLFRNLPGVSFVGRIHEQITPSLQRLNGRFALLEAEIEHLGYNLSEEQMKAKIERNLMALQTQHQEEPSNSYATFQLGQTCLLAGRYDEGINYLEKALTGRNVPPSLHSTINLIIANEEFRREEYPAAIDRIREALRRTPKQRLGWFLLSECFAKQGEYGEAIEALKQLKSYKDLLYSDISIDKVFEDYLVEQRLALYYHQLRAYPQAVAHFRNYFFLSSTYRVAHFEKLIELRAEKSVRIKDWDRLLEHIIEHIDQFDDSVEAIRLLAGHLQDAGQSPAMESLLKRAVTLFPDNPTYLYYLGNSYMEQGSYAEAESMFVRALELTKSVYEIHFNLAVSAIRQQAYDRAIPCFEEIYRRFPRYRDDAGRYLQLLREKLNGAGGTPTIA